MSTTISPRRSRHLGLGSIVGGLALGVWVGLVLVNPTGGYVGYLDPIWVVWNLGIGFGAVGLYGRLAGRSSRWRTVGVGVAILGAMLSIVGAVLGGFALLFTGGVVDRLQELNFLLALFGTLGLLVGSAILGVVSFRTGVVPRWMAGLLVLGCVVFLGINDTDVRVLLALPYALAWVAIGYRLVDDANSG